MLLTRLMQLRDIKKSSKITRILLPAYIKSRFKPIPIWTHFYLTRKCNLQCKYCFVRDNTKKDMKKNEIFKVIDKLHSLGCKLVVFLGGEPTLRKDLIDIIKYAKNKNIITYLTTNGILLNSEYIDKLGKSGIDVINLSIDSVFDFDYSKKDYIRRKKVLINLIKARKKYGFEIIVNLVLTNKNISTITKTIKLIHNLKIPISVGFIVGNTYSNVPQDKELFFITDKEKDELYKTLDEIKRLKKQKYNIIEPMRYFKDIKKFINHKLNWYCTAGEYYFSVDSDGKFQICAGLPAENRSIFEIDKNYFKKFKDIREKRLNKCKKICLSSCLYVTSYYIKHPSYFIKELFY